MHRYETISKTELLMAGIFLVFAALVSIAFMLSGPLALKNIVLSTAFLLAGYFYGDRMVTWLLQIKPLGEEKPEVAAMVEGLSEDYGLPTPRMGVWEIPLPNAFVVGRSPETALLVLTRGTLDKLDEYDLRGVIAHELAHVYLNHTAMLTMVGVVGTLMRRLMRGQLGPLATSVAVRSGVALVGVLTVILAYVAYLTVTIAGRMLQHSVEFDADEEAARTLGDPGPLVSALRKLEYFGRGRLITPQLLKEMEREQRSFPETLSPLINTHPRTEDRIRALNKMPRSRRWRTPILRLRKEPEVTE